VKDISEQQKQILAQAKQRLQLELMRDAFTSEHDKIDNKHKYALALEEGDESEEMDSEQTKEEVMCFIYPYNKLLTLIRFCSVQELGARAFF